MRDTRCICPSQPSGGILQNKMRWGSRPAGRGRSDRNERSSCRLGMACIRDWTDGWNVKAVAVVHNCEIRHVIWENGTSKRTVSQSQSSLMKPQTNERKGFRAFRQWSIHLAGSGVEWQVTLPEARSSRYGRFARIESVQSPSSSFPGKDSSCQCRNPFMVPP